MREPTPCPYCGHVSVFRPPEWTHGRPLVCANPYCDSNFGHPNDGTVDEDEDP